ncbi:hypothetical protein [Vibrio sp.]|uniref:hypothetical protein n=1 Tax=Vibrio sp. TaxID=678 RepID=UPI00379C2EC7
MSLTPINRSAISEQMALDLQKSLSIHPNSFECLLFRADLNALEDHAPNQEDVVGNLEAREETFSYSSPVKTRALELPNSDSSSVMLALGDDTDDGETPITMLIQAQSVPEQSVLWYEELVDDNNIKVTLMYVLSAKPIGKHGKGGFKYDLVPFDLGGDVLPGDSNNQLPTQDQGLSDESIDTITVESVSNQDDNLQNKVGSIADVFDGAFTLGSINE